MKVSLNWIKQLTDVELPVDEVVQKIGTQLGAVEEVVDTSKKYQGLMVVKVVECVKHPNADKLSLCLVDDGGVNKKVDRKENGLIQIVCGAPNVKAGMLAVWIPPGSTVPESYDKEPFVIEARPIRNKTSHGMLASAKELGIGNDHSGIVEIDKDAKPGDDFAELYRMDDYIIDIENKMFTHRPDLFGHIGVAREIAGIQGRKFKSPDWYKEDASLPSDGRKNVLKLSVKNDIPSLVPRFCAVAVKDVKVGPSPLWLRASLSRLGVNSINNIVDITNFYMLLSSQPLHAYDYDKVKTGMLSTRLSKKGEKLRLLNGKEITLQVGSMLITDGHNPIGLAGVMGGADTEVDENTKNVIFECATFDMNATRRSSMAYGLFTDASTRFTKNQSPRQNRAVIVKAVQETLKIAGGRIASPLIDDVSDKAGDKPVKVGIDFINSRLGEDLSAREITKLLENVEFKVELQGKRIDVKAPFWRTDIEIPEDIVEEVGRLYGYDKLPLDLPARTIEPSQKNGLMSFKDSVREIMAAAGANEVLTYSFVHTNLLSKVNQDPKKAYKLSNASSPSIEYYRFNLVPSLLDKAHPNIKNGFDRFALYEIGKGHDKDHSDDDGLPQEFELLALVYTVSAKVNSTGTAFFEVKAYLTNLADELGIDLVFKPISELPAAPLAQAYMASRTAMVSTKQGKYLGIIGEFKHNVRRQLKLPDQTAGFEIDLEALYSAAPSVKPYKSLSRFPETYQDLCLRTDNELSYEALTAFVGERFGKVSAEHGYGFNLEPLDIYRPDGKDYKQTTWRIHLWHPDRTLTTDETNKLMDEIAHAAKKELKAERI
jgi:phenylalanyl-tRNA synthetase beta chain